MNITTLVNDTWLCRCDSPRMDKQTLIGRHFRQLREAKGMSQPDLAGKADTAVQNVSRLERGERKMSLKWAELFAPHLGVKPAELMYPPDDLSAGPDAEGFDQVELTRLPIRGEVAAGQWLETVPFLDDLEITDWIDGIAVAPSLQQFTYCLRVKGTSINRIAPDGTFLVCIDITSGIEIHDRDIVIVERVRDQGALREVTAKRLGRRGDQIVLIPESDDPMWQKEIVLDHDPYQMDAEVRIVAKVRHVIRPV